MYRSKLIELYKKLSKQDLTALRKFVRSPFFNQREDVIRLCDYILKAIRQEDFKQLSKPKAFQYVFTSATYEDRQMRYVMSFLLKLTMQYLSYTELTKDEFRTKVYLSKALRLRGVDILFEKVWKNALKIQTQETSKNAQFHYNNYLCYLEKYEYIHRRKRSGEMKLQEISNEITTFYIAEILRLSCAIFTHQTMTTQAYEISMLENVLQEVANGGYEEIPSVAIYYCGYLALSDKDHKHYFKKLKTLIQKYWKRFPESEIRDIYLLAINYCIKHLNRGERDYIREAFELYRLALSNNVLLENDVLSSFTYNNIRSLAFALNEIEWVENFLENYKKKLPVKNRESTYLYNRAIFYFRKPDYASAMRLLQKVEFEDLLYNLDTRRMLLRIYFELQEFDALSSLLDSFKIYIGRQKNMGYHGENYLNLIYFVKKILKNNMHNKVFRNQLIEEVKATKAIAERDWLLSQLESKK